MDNHERLSFCWLSLRRVQGGNIERRKDNDGDERIVVEDPTQRDKDSEGGVQLQLSSVEEADPSGVQNSIGSDNKIRGK